MKMKIKNGTVFDGIFKMELKYRWRPIVLCCVVLCCVVLCCGGVVWCGVVWCGVVWCGVVVCRWLWCGVWWWCVCRVSEKTKKERTHIISYTGYIIHNIIIALKTPNPFHICIVEHNITSRILNIPSPEIHVVRRSI
jgi:hypothetical protein